MFDTIRSFFDTPPKRATSPLGAGLSDQDEPAIPAFQKAWKEGATFDDLFGPQPFGLHGSIGRSGADNHRPDVAKVETFLGDAGYYKPLTKDGPSGWHSTNLDSAIRSFQKDNGLEVDGILKPNGPTIGKIGSLLGGGAAPAPAENVAAPGTQGWIDQDLGKKMGDILGTPIPKPPAPPAPPVDDPNLPGGDIWEKPQSQPPTGGQDDLEALIRIMNGGKKPEPTGTSPREPVKGVDYIEINGWNPYEPPIRVPLRGTGSAPDPRDPFPGHTISEDGAKEHDDWAKLLVKDSDPSQTARMLKVAIDEYGDQGRGDVADLLGRFHRIDPAKAKILHRVLKESSGEDLPFRVAPTGEGFRELTDEEKIARAPKNPFGSKEGADPWAAGNMADVLLGKGDYADAITHFRTDQSATMPYLAAVHEQMRDKNPMAAMKFATQMQKAGLAMAADGEGANDPAPGPADEPAPQPPEPEQPEPPTPDQPDDAENGDGKQDSAGEDGGHNDDRGDEEQLAQGQNEGPKPTDKPVNPDELYKQLGYESEGDGDAGGLIKHPIDGTRAGLLAREALQAAQNEYGKENSSLGDGEGDAFRHALWSYKMTKELGEGAAKRVGDSHERNDRPDGERLMDLLNNEVGRRLAADPNNKGRPDEEVIREAIRNGQLQLRPFNVPKPAGTLSRPPRI
jgi:peptidoglycan hydrolase-like protein with peptidoglycan-binding domain